MMGIYGIASDNDILQIKSSVLMYFFIHVILHRDVLRAVTTALRVVYIASRWVYIMYIVYLASLNRS